MASSCNSIAQPFPLHSPLAGSATESSPGSRTNRTVGGCREGSAQRTLIVLEETATLGNRKGRMEVEALDDFLAEFPSVGQRSW